MAPRDTKIINLAEKRAEKQRQAPARPTTVAPSRPTFTPPARPTPAIPSSPVAKPAPVRPTAPARPVAPAPSAARPVAPAPVRPVAAARPAAPVLTPTQKGVIILKEKEALQKAQQVAATTQSPAVKTAAVKEVNARAVRLQQIVEASKKDRGEKPVVRPPVAPRVPKQRLPPAVAVQRQEQLAISAQQKAAEIQRLKQQSQVADPRTKKFLDLVAAQKAAEVKKLKERAIQLDKGTDVYRPPALPADRAPKPRVPLALPRAHVKPPPSETKKLVAAIALRSPRVPGETEAQYKARLYALTQRAATRWAQHYTKWYVGEIPKTPTSGDSSGTLPGQNSYTPPSSTTVGDQVIVALAEQTVQEDGPVIASEIAAGGVVQDPAAEEMAPTVDEAVKEINAVVTTSDGQTVDDIVVDAEGEAAEQMETVDKSAVPLYKQPVVIAAAVAALGFYLYKRGVFK